MKYAGIINNDVVNGQDVCVSYWCQGCRFRCPGCQNPQTWDFNGGIEIDENKLLNQIIELISKNGIQRNLSILGGEPLCDENLSFTYRLIKTVKSVYPYIHIFCWTGYKYEDLKDFCNRKDWYTPEQIGNSNKMFDILHDIDILVDGQFDINNRDITLPFRGSKNQRVIDMAKTSASNGEEIILWEIK